MKSSRFKTIRRVLSVLVIGFVAVLFWKSLSSNWHNIQDQHVNFFPHGLIAIVLFSLAVIMTGYLWGMILDQLTGQHTDRVEAIRVQLASWLLKYVPGQTGSFVYKISWGNKKDIPKSKITISFFYENLFLTIASIAPTVPILLLQLGDRTQYNLSLILGIIIVIPVLISHGKVVRQVEKLILKVTKKNLSLSYFSYRHMAYYSALYVLPRIVNAVGFIFIASSFLHIDPSMYLILAATYALAGIIGIYAIFVPSGLGVREGVITLFLSAYFPTHQAIALALLARFYATIADGVLALVFVVLTKYKKTA